MDHKQLVEPDHAENSRGEREESHQPLHHQHYCLPKKERTYHNDPNERLLLLGPGCPMPYLRQEDAKHHQVEDIAKRQLLYSDKK